MPEVRFRVLLFVFSSLDMSPMEVDAEGEFPDELEHLTETPTRRELLVAVALAKLAWAKKCTKSHHWLKDKSLRQKCFYL